MVEVFGAGIMCRVVVSLGCGGGSWERISGGEEA